MFASDTFRIPWTSCRFGVLVLLCLGMAGCATSRPQGVDLPDISRWEARQQVLGSLRRWEFRGRIAVKSGDDGFNAKFDWRQDGQRFNARVSGPLGIGTVLLEGTDQRITLTDKDGEQVVLHDPETELMLRYGWTIPVRTMRYWALGIPDPLSPAATELDEMQRLASLLQNDWRVEISRYRRNSGQELPRTLTATKPKTRIRMVIDRWLFFDY